MEKLYEAVEVLKQKREGKSFSFFFSLVKNLLSSFKTTSAMAYNFHFNVSRQLLDQVPAASFFFFLNLQKKLLDQNFSYAALLDEKEAKGNSLVPKLDTLLSLFSFPSSNIDEKSATFSLEGKKYKSALNPLLTPLRPHHGFIKYMVCQHMFQARNRVIGLLQGIRLQLKFFCQY